MEDKDMHHIPIITAFFYTWKKMPPLAVTPEHCRPKGGFSFKFETIPPWSSVRRAPQIISRRSKRCAPSISGKEGRGRWRQRNGLNQRKDAKECARFHFLLGLSLTMAGRFGFFGAQQNHGNLFFGIFTCALAANVYQPPLCALALMKDPNSR